MNRLILAASLAALSCVSLTAIAQVAPVVPNAVVDTIGLRSQSAKIKANVLHDSRLPSATPAEAGSARGIVPIMVCEVVPAYKKRNRKDSLLLFVKENLQWPDKTGRMCIDGRVYVSFVVGEKGQVYDAKVLKGLHPLFDAEALRVVQLLDGHFTPALCGGVAKAHEYFLPVFFSLK